MTYAILFNPNYNRVYFEASQKLSLAEFEICAGSFSVPHSDLQIQEIAGAVYLTFATAAALSQGDIAIVSGLSFAYTLSVLENFDNEVYFKPIAKQKTSFVDDGMGTMLKYTGKTNETFTRMMLNVAYYSQARRDGLHLLDPIAGKGTTLFEGLVKGFNAYGIEIADALVNECYHFTKRFFETAKYKFSHDAVRISGANKSFTALRHTFDVAPTKEMHKNKDSRTIEFVSGNSEYANLYYKRNSFDILVGDLPYGVQHRNVTREKQSAFTRNPHELLRVCLPAWVDVLKKGGIIALSWNCNVLERSKIEELFAKSGLTVKNDDVFLQFEHRVDQAILRDVIVAQK